MTREEALKAIRGLIGLLTDDFQEAVISAIPELIEGEDERIWMALIEGVSQIRCKGDITREQMLTYLEKQKEKTRKITANLLEDGITGVQRELIEFLANNIDASWVDIIKSADAYAQRIRSIVEKQKEQKPMNIDYISGIREELLGIEDNAKNIDGLTESQWVAIRAAHRLLGEYIEQEQKVAEFTHHEINESLKDAVTHQMEDDGDIDDFVRKGIDDVILKYAELGAKWQKEQKEQVPYIDFVIKPHKGDDTNPYDMRASEAQEYAVNRGFGIPFIDGEVYVDERHMIQTIGNIIRWADEHPKEQKPVEVDESTKRLNENWMKQYFDEQKPVDYEAELKKCKENPLYFYDKYVSIKQKPDTRDANDLQLLGFIYDLLNEIEWKDNWAMSKDECLQRLNNYRPQKSVEWSEEDEKMRNLAIDWAETISGQFSFVDMDSMDFRKIITWLKSLPERFNLQPKEEWNEEDEKMLNLTKTQLRILQSHLSHTYSERMSDMEYSSQLLQIEKCVSWLDIRLKSLRPQPKKELSLLDENIINAAVAFVEQNDHFNCWGGIDKHTVIKALRSLKPHWKPSEEQMSLLWSIYQGGEEQEPLRELIEQLKKL